MVELTQHNKKIVVLWVLGIFAFIGYTYFATNETNPEFRTNISLTTNQEIISILVLLVVFAILSVILKGSTNRMVNLISGVVVFLGFLAAFIDAITVNFSGLYNLMLGIEVIIMINLIYFAYRMPKTQT